MGRTFSILTRIVAPATYQRDTLAAWLFAFSILTRIVAPATGIGEQMMAGMAAFSILTRIVAPATNEFYTVVNLGCKLSVSSPGS